MIDGIRVSNPLLAIERLDAALAVELCEALYSTKEGREAIERDRAEFRRLSAHAQKVLTQAALFTDSSAEILVIRALKARGLKVESNYLIGAYRWDIVLPDYKIAIEINGLQFHSALTPWIRDHWKNLQRRRSSPHVDTARNFGDVPTPQKLLPRTPIRT